MRSKHWKRMVPCVAAGWRRAASCAATHGARAATIPFPTRPAGTVNVPERNAYVTHPNTSRQAPLHFRGFAPFRFVKALWIRSEEHTSELQSRENLVCRLLLEKKKKNTSTSKMT